MTAKVITPRQSYTKGEFERDVVGLAGYLRNRGVKSGDRVLLKGKNSYPFAVTLFSLIHLNTSIVLVDHQQTQKQTDEMLLRANVRWKLLGSLDKENSGDSHSFFYEEWIRQSKALPDSSETLSFHEWRERRDAAILWSSGSTGEPKGIVKSGRSIWDNIEKTRMAMDYRDDDVLMPLLPFSHYYGLSILLIWWQQQCSLVIPQYHMLNQVANLIIREGVTVIDAAPSTYYSLLNLVQKKLELVEQMRQVRMWCVGGAPLSKQLTDQFYQAFGMLLLDGYGLTEVGNVAVSNLNTPSACGYPLNDVDVQIKDDSGKEIPVCETGGIWVRSHGLMEGYLDSDGTIVPQQSKWYDTGDIGFFDTDGYLHVIGRKHAVHRMGYTLYLASLEKKAEECGCPVKVIALDEERKGCSLHFFIEDHETRSFHFWQKQIYPLLFSYERPDEIWVLEQFPLNHNGKVDLVKLREFAVNKRKESHLTANVDRGEMQYVIPSSKLD
ncbi:class I adenylate-forming enzyme family protein [Desmospora activa]|uniref:Acyl-CoA synthetase (AMP-forming)/AMP-acid ligase II n=1 Tax=Desmospora activa DSM 45169 TaxID=1121389 RepID=A0A2T4ZAC1_9BACL|nr:class I adenylate-forming enzyme family protein [Desmospora activa]PTM58839.1 acyl-CoA synthetase (AMP-forming)/AMP-acid ligase II [Desmospora activa DSM 45169]